MKSETDGGDAAAVESDSLSFVDVITAKTISSKVTTEVSLAYAFQRLNDRGCVLFRDRAAVVVKERWGSDGDVASLRLVEIVDGHRQRAVVVRGQPHWLRKIISAHDRQAITIDESGQCWLGEANGHDQPLCDDFDPEEITETVGCIIDATEVGYDMPAQGFFDGLCEQHFGGDQVTDEQRSTLLEKLDRLRRCGYAPSKKETG